MDHVPGLPTVAWQEAAWMVMALIACVVSFRTRLTWALVRRNLTATDDAGARAVAEMLDWTCRGLVAAAVVEAVAAVPSLYFPPRPDAPSTGVAWFLLLLVPVISFAFSGGIIGLALYLNYQTRRIGRGGYRGPERRGAILAGHDGPERRRPPA